MCLDVFSAYEVVSNVNGMVLSISDMRFTVELRHIYVRRLF